MIIALVPTANCQRCDLACHFLYLSFFLGLLIHVLFGQVVLSYARCCWSAASTALRRIIQSDVSIF